MNGNEAGPNCIRRAQPLHCIDERFAERAVPALRILFAGEDRRPGAMWVTRCIAHQCWGISPLSGSRGACRGEATRIVAARIERSGRRRLLARIDLARNPQFLALGRTQLSRSGAFASEGSALSLVHAAVSRLRRGLTPARSIPRTGGGRAQLNRHLGAYVCVSNCNRDVNLFIMNCA
jgi:hypothetical protein